MEINEGLLRKYIFHNQVLREHNESMIDCYLEGAYDNEEELENDMIYSSKRAKKIEEFERELLKELNKQFSIH